MGFAKTHISMMELGSQRFTLTVAHLGEGPTVAANQWGATIKGLRVT